MIKEHLVSASITNGADCICNPEVLLGTKFGLWDFENQVAPKGTLVDLNAAWELFLSRQDFIDVSFDTKEHKKHEVIDGVVYEEGDTTYTLLDDNGNPTNATFTIKANKGPIEHIEWQDGKLYLYYRKQRPLEDKDMQEGIPIHYVTDDDGTTIIDEETGKPLIYDYVAIPVLEIFDNDETKQLFPWFSDDNEVVQLRDSIDGRDGHLGSFAITPESEVYYSKDVDSAKNQDLISLQSVQKQLNKDLGFEPTYEKAMDYPDPDDGEYHTYKANGSDLANKLHEGFGDKSNIVNAVNEDLVRTRINTRLLADKIVESNLDWQNLLEFADSIKNQAFRNSVVPNVLAAINWIQTAEIGPFKEEIDPNIKKDNATVENITEALNVIFTEAEENRDRIGYDRTTGQWIELTTDNKDTLTEAINETDEHINSLAAIMQVTEEWDPVHHKTYYSNPDLNNITKNRLRVGVTQKDDVTIVEAINELQSQIGNLSSSKSGDNSIELTTDNKETLVDAVNEVDLHADNNYNTIGATYNIDAVGKKNSEINNLTTHNKNTIVDAINEHDSEIGDLDQLNTDNQTSLVDSINEVIQESPFIYENTEDPESGVVLKNRNNHAGNSSLVVGANNSSYTYDLINGSGNDVQGGFSLVSGFNNVSKKNANVVTGKGNTNDGKYNLVNGLSNTVTGDNNIVSGSNNTVIIDNSVVFGDNIYAKNSDNLFAAGNTINIKDSVEDGIVIGRNSKLNGNKSIALGSQNFVGEKSVAIGINNENEGSDNVSIGKNNYTGCENSYTFGNGNRTEGDNTYVVGESNSIKGNSDYAFGFNQIVEGNNDIVIGAKNKVRANNAIVIGEIDAVHDDSTHIGGDKIYIKTHDTESKLQDLIFVNLNDWCKQNNAASLNGEKFLDTQHVINALKVYLFHEYADNALLRFTMQDNNENGFILVQGKSKRIFLNGTYYFTDNIENGWSRREGEYIKVINKTIVDSNGNTKVKHYLALMDQLSTDAIVDTTGAQRSNTEDFKNIDLTHAYGALDMDDVEEALDLVNRYNEKVDKYAKVITKYQDSDGIYTDKVQNWFDQDNPSRSGNITLSLKDSFGFDKFEYQLRSEKGEPNGYAPLDAQGLVPSDYLPSYVDDVIDVWAEYEVDSLTKDLVNIKLYKIIDRLDETGSEVINKGEPIITGEKGKIYVEAQPKPEGYVSYQFRYTGTRFVAIGAHIVIGEVEGTAFDGGRGKELEDNFNDHIKSGTTTIPVINEETGRQKVDENGNPIWVTYKPNPHNVTAEQLTVTVNDPNDPSNTSLEDIYTRAYNVDSAIKELFNRINVSEDQQGSMINILGTPEDIERLDELDEIEGNGSPTLIGTVLSNKAKIDSINTIEDNSIDNLVDTYFKLYGEN